MKFSNITLLLASICSVSAVKEGTDELGRAASLFSGDLMEADFVKKPTPSASFYNKLATPVNDDPRFQWLESPLYSEEGNYILFSDVKWKDETGVTCGMLWKYDLATDTLIDLLKCSGLAGPTPEYPPVDLAERVEAGSNGLFWSGESDGELLMNQHGYSRMVRLNVNDIDEAKKTIDPEKVEIVVDSYHGARLNSPNDLAVSPDNGDIYFTDPPFGLQISSVDDPFANSFERMTQDAPAVYRVTEEGSVQRILEFDVPDYMIKVSREMSLWEHRDDSARYGPNGIALIPKPDDPLLTPAGKSSDAGFEVAISITDFHDPRVEIYDQNEDGTLGPAPKLVLRQDYRIEGEHSALPALSDGLTYLPEQQVLALSGPGGMYFYDTSNASYDLLGFLRIDDLCSNNNVGGGYLWMTCNQRILRIPLAGQEGKLLDEAASVDDAATSGGWAPSYPSILGLALVPMLHAIFFH